MENHQEERKLKQKGQTYKKKKSQKVIQNKGNKGLGNGILKNIFSFLEHTEFHF